MNTLAERLKFARTDKGWSQGQLAAASGLTPAAISNIEKGIRQAKGSLPQIAEALGISHKWLAYGEGEMMDNNNPPVRAANDGDELSALARSLGELFDTLPKGDRVLRSRAYGAASAAILLLKDQQPAGQPIAAPLGSSEKPPVLPQPPTVRNT